MATILWSSLDDGDSIAFDPTDDRLRFDGTSISATDVFIDSNDLRTVTIFTVGEKSVTLQYDPFATTTVNVFFDNGSRFLVGDNTTGTVADDGPNTLIG